MRTSKSIFISCALWVVLATAQGASAFAADFVGTWINENTTTKGLGFFVVEPDLTYRAYVLCKPAGCFSGCVPLPVKNMAALVAGLKLKHAGPGRLCDGTAAEKTCFKKITADKLADIASKYPPPFQKILELPGWDKCGPRKQGIGGVF